LNIMTIIRCFAQRIMIITIILMTTTSMNVYAGDVLHRMLYADEVESLADDQDAIILFEVMKISESTIEANVLFVVSGEVTAESITIKNNNIRLQGMLPDPELNTGDYCVMSVKKYGNNYKQALMALKADSGDYETLKFYYSSHASDIDALQYYVNSGGIEKDFSFDGAKVVVRLEDGGEKEITLPLTGYLPEVEVVTEVPTEAFTVSDTINETTSNEISVPEDAGRTGQNIFSATNIGLVVIAGIFGLGFGRRLRRK